MVWGAITHQRERPGVVCLCHAGVVRLQHNPMEILRSHGTRFVRTHTHTHTDAYVLLIARSALRVDSRRTEMRCDSFATARLVISVDAASCRTVQPSPRRDSSPAPSRMAAILSSCPLTPSHARNAPVAAGPSPHSGGGRGFVHCASCVSKLVLKLRHRKVSFVARGARSKRNRETAYLSNAMHAVAMAAFRSPIVCAEHGSASAPAMAVRSPNLTANTRADCRGELRFPSRGRTARE